MRITICNWRRFIAFALFLFSSILSVRTSCSRSPLSFLMASSSSTTVDYESCRLRSVSPHFKTLPSGRVKGYGTPVQHQSNLCRVWDELSVFVDSSYVRFVSLCCNYCTDNTPEILLICRGLVDAKALGGNDGTRWLSAHPLTWISYFLAFSSF